MASDNYNKINIRLIGIREDNQYEAWKSLTIAALKEISTPFELKEVNSVDKIIDLGLTAIPALIMNNSIILEQNTHTPNKKEIKEAIQEQLSKQSIKMKSIVVPTDFSQTAENAFNYAKALSEQIGSQLKVVHICHPETDSTYGISIQNTADLLQSKRKILNKFIHKNDPDDFKDIVETSMFEQEVRLGYASNELVLISKEDKTDLLLMGTTGKGNMLENMFGSVSTYVSQNAQSPVWLIPPTAKYKGINNILYASNYESANELSMNKITELANIFQADVHLVHVNDPRKKGDAQFEELVLTELFKKKAPNLDFKMSTIHKTKVWEGIYEYAEKNDIDLVVMLTHQRKFWEWLQHKSMTKRMVLHAKAPLLILHLEDSNN